MRNIIRATFIVAVAAAIATGTAGAVTPANGGDAGGSIVTINSSAGDQRPSRM
jgi:hypothetical protein